MPWVLNDLRLFLNHYTKTSWRLSTAIDKQALIWIMKMALILYSSSN